MKTPRETIFYKRRNTNHENSQIFYSEETLTMKTPLRKIFLSEETLHHENSCRRNWKKEITKFGNAINYEIA